MKKRLFFYCFIICIASQAQEPPCDHIFFVNSPMDGNYFYSKTDDFGPRSIKNENGKLPVSKTIFHTPGNSLQLEYRNHEDGLWQATVYRHQVRGQDHFKKASYFSFWLYNPSASTKSENLPMAKLMKKDSTLSNELPFKTTKVKSWEQVIIPLDKPGADISNPEDIIGIVFLQKKFNGSSHTLYIDDIEFLSMNSASSITDKPVIVSSKGYAKHVDISWQPFTDEEVKYVKIYRSEKGHTFIPIGIQSPQINRYTDFTGVTGKTYYYKISFLNHQYAEGGLSNIISATTKAMTDDQLLTMVQKACFRYYWEGKESTSGLAKENIPGRQNMIASGASGFGIMALIAGTERSFITRKESVERFIKIVNFLEKAEKFHGAFSHFIDGPTGKVEPFFGMRDNGGDLVETSFLMQGLLAARAYFNKDYSGEKQIRDKITKLWENVEWDWYRKQPESNFLTWHWSPDKGWVINHQLIGWNETMITYLLAIASPTHGVPAVMYYSGWANQDSTGRQYRINWGGTTDGSMYTNGKTYFDIKLDVGVSNGGPLFFTHYSYLGYDPHLITDRYTNYFTNNRNIALINYRYCLKNPNNYKGYGPGCWGLTASDGPFNYSADEPVQKRDYGKIAPTGAISSFPYTPVESMKALKNYYNNDGKFLWGEYGFRDAFNLTENWCSEIYMGLNQAPMVVMIENYRSGLLWKFFMNDKDVQNGLKKLNEESLIAK